MQWFENVIDKYRPAAQSVADTAIAYMERIIGRLDMIHNDLTQEDFAEIRRKFTGVAAGAGTVDIAQVPAGQTWEVEVVTLDGAGNGALLIDGIAVLGRNIAAGADGVVGANVIAFGGQLLQFRASAAMTIYVQVKLHKFVRPRITNHTGTPEQQPDHDSLTPDSRQEAYLSGRHGRLVDAAVNPIGERRGDGLTDMYPLTDVTRR